MNIQNIKQKFRIVGNDKLLNRAIETAIQVAPTDISVFVSGESGTGKETIPKIIHENSSRKHNKYIAVNCGAIPEGTIDSELFGHEKGSFTGAHDNRKGYFETANEGTIFLDEVAELPMSTQARLLRVLENGEFIKVGSSQPIKTNVRVIAATNVNITEAINKSKFREDLYYRLNTISILMPPLRDRKEDIHLLFRKFASDFSDRYKKPTIRLDEKAMNIITEYYWPGNIRQLKNFVSQLSIIQENKLISDDIISNALPDYKRNAPVLFENNNSEISEREILYKVLFDMKKDLTELKKITFDIIKKESQLDPSQDIFQDINNKNITLLSKETKQETVEIEETLSLANHEKKLIQKSLERHKGKRKLAAKELGISERTLYRKIKEFNL